MSWQAEVLPLAILAGVQMLIAFVVGGYLLHTLTRNGRRP